jgi:hypothetical protein
MRADAATQAAKTNRCAIADPVHHIGSGAAELEMKW